MRYRIIHITIIIIPNNVTTRWSHWQLTIPLRKATIIYKNVIVVFTHRMECLLQLLLPIILL